MFADYFGLCGTTCFVQALNHLYAATQLPSENSELKSPGA
jgi:hypothetical protein